MEDKEIDLIEITREILKEKKKLILYGFIAGVVGIIIAFSLPREYSVRITAVPEGKSQSSSSSSMSGIASMMGLNIGKTNTGGITVLLYPEIVSSTPFLMELSTLEITTGDGVQMPLYEYLLENQKKPWWSYIFGVFGIFSSDKEPVAFQESIKSQESYFAAIRKLLSMDLDDKTSSIVLSVTMQDPQVALTVAESAMSILKEFIIDYNTRKSSEDLVSSQKMADEAKQNYYRADSLYAAAVDQNRNLVSQSAIIKLEKLQNERDLSYTIYQQFATKVELGRVQLLEDTPVVTIVQPAILPTKPASPNKKLIVIAFAFLGGAIFVAKKVFAIITRK